MSYDFTPRISGRVMVTNLVNQCFGGSSEPWTRAYPPNSAICGYISNIFYNGGNFFNGSSPYDIAANGARENPYFAQSFAPVIRRRDSRSIIRSRLTSIFRCRSSSRGRDDTAAGRRRLELVEPSADSRGSGDAAVVGHRALQREHAADKEVQRNRRFR